MTARFRRFAGAVCSRPVLLALVLVTVVASSAGVAAADAVVSDRTDRTDTLAPVQAQTDGTLTVRPSTVDFGTVSVGDSVTRTVTIANESPNPVTVSSVSFPGNASGFEFVEPSAMKSQLDVGTVTIPPGVQQTVTVEFAPETARDYGGQFTVLSESGSTVASVTVTARGVAPDIAVQPQSLTFADATVGEQSSKMVTISNVGNAPLTLDGASIKGPSVYSAGNVDGTTLAAGESTEVEVGFEPNTTTPRTGALAVRSDDPDEPAILVGLSSTDTELQVSATSGNRSQQVEVSVRNVEAGERVDVPMPDSGDENESAAMESVWVKSNVSGDLTLSVNKSERPAVLEHEFETGDNATGLLHLDVRKSISNDAIDAVGYRYRVRKSVLANSSTDPEDVAMYRYENGTWVEKNTTLVGQTETHFIFLTKASGFSEWTAAAKRPSIEVAQAEANLSAATVGETAAINVRLTNTGGADGVYVTKLLLNGSVVERREVTVPDGGTVQVRFLRPFEQPGTYRVTVNDVPVGVIEVSESKSVEVGTATPAESSQTPQSDDGSGAETASTAQGDVSDGGNGSETGDSSVSSDSSDDGTSGLSSSTLPVLFGAGAVVLVGVLGWALYTRSDEDTTPPDSTESEAAEADAEEDSVVEVEGFDTDEGDAGGSDEEEGT